MRRSPAPQSENDGHERQFHEPITGMDAGELPWHVVPHYGSHKNHENESEPKPHSKLHSSLPVTDPKKHDETCNHIGDDKFPTQFRSFLPGGHLSHVSGCPGILSEQIHSRFAEN